MRLSYAGDAGELREGVARLRAFAERVWNPITGHHTATYHPMEVLALRLKARLGRQFRLVGASDGLLVILGAFEHFLGPRVDALLLGA